MKKSLRLLITLLCIAASNSLHAQWVTDASGNVSIDRVGTTSTTSVTINNTTAGLYKSSILKIGDYEIKQSWSGNYCGTGNFMIRNALNPSTTPTFVMYNNRIGFSFQNNLLCQSGVLSSPAKYFFDTLTAMNRLFIGNLVINNPALNPKYRLYVAGSMICEELVIKLQANWADYVFSPSYKLRPLSEVKTFIAENNHLPDVPAACEVEENGVATGEMLTIQMKKIEELTLYLIQMEERIKELEKQNEALKTK